MLNGDSNLYPEIREKYFGFCSQFSSTPDSDYLDKLPKSGGNSVLWRAEDLCSKDWLSVGG